MFSKQIIKETNILLSVLSPKQLKSILQHNLIMPGLDKYKNQSKLLLEYLEYLEKEGVLWGA